MCFFFPFKTDGGEERNFLILNTSPIHSFCRVRPNTIDERKKEKNIYLKKNKNKTLNQQIVSETTRSEEESH
jgi:hypothetical protein